MTFILFLKGSECESKARLKSRLQRR